MNNLHVPLPEPTYQKLRAEAERSKKPATVLAREAIEKWLKEKKKMETHRAIADYAGRCAGSEADLDKGLEAASREHLLREDD